jgi:hypothetical protein
MGAGLGSGALLLGSLPRGQRWGQDVKASIKPAVHFVGFRGEEYWSAVKIWGLPDFIHIGWDRYAMHAIIPEDTVVFAKGEWTQEPNHYGYPDMKRGPLHLYD